MVHHTDIGPFSSSATGITYVPSSGKYAIVDNGSDAVYIFEKFGILERQFSLSPFSRGTTGIASLPDGRFVISDSTEDKVFIVSSAGALLSAFPTTTFGSSNPQGIAYIPTTGNLAIVDPTQDEVYIVSLGGVVQGQFDTAGLGISNPVGIAFLPGTGGFAIIDSSLDLFLVNASGTLQDRFSIALGGILMDIEDVAFNSAGGNFIFADRGQEEVFEYDIRGHVLSQFSTSLLLASHDPSGIPLSNLLKRGRWWTESKGRSFFRFRGETPGRMRYLWDYEQPHRYGLHPGRRELRSHG